MFRSENLKRFQSLLAMAVMVIVIELAGAERS
jgi:hypothetical protein